MKSAFDDVQVERIQEDQRRANGRVVAQILAARTAPAEEPAEGPAVDEPVDSGAV